MLRTFIELKVEPEIFCASEKPNCDLSQVNNTEERDIYESIDFGLDTRFNHIVIFSL
jgi:hypothetical protein